MRMLVSGSNPTFVISSIATRHVEVEDTIHASGDVLSIARLTNDLRKRCAPAAAASKLEA